MRVGHLQNWSLGDDRPDKDGVVVSPYISYVGVKEKVNGKTL